MSNYIIVNNSNKAYEAFNCINVKEAIKKYLENFVSQNNDYWISFIKIFDSNLLPVKESLNIFYAIFEYAVDYDDYIKAIYNIDNKGIDFEK